MKKLSVRKFTAAYSLVTGVGLLAFAATAFGQAAAPASDKKEKKTDDTQTLEKFEVTGSRIKRIDAETPSPVVRITRQDLQNTGFSNVDDALRAMPINNGQAIVPDGSGNGFASGTSTINLRGLGNNNTLVLINGRRAVPSGAGAFNGFQSVIDLRQIPTAAIDSVDVLKDGASAIYGSDAVAGVINITLRKEYQGVGTTIGFGNTASKDSFEKSGFLIVGATAGKTSLVATMNVYHRNAIKDSDYGFSHTADLRADKSGTGQIETNADGTIVTGVDLRSSSSFPARYFIPGTTTIRTFLNRTTDPQQANAVAVSRVTGAGLYDFQQDTYQEPEVDFRGVSFYATHEFSDSIKGFADMMFQRADAVNKAAPSPFTTTDKGSGTNGRLLIPVDNPYNPYGTRYLGSAAQSIELSTYRLVNAGPRIRDTTSDYPRLVAGLEGKLPMDWSWEAYYMFAQGSYYDASPGTSFDSAVQAALMGVTIDGNKLYANPFGAEDPRVTRYYSGNNPTKTTFTGNVYNVSTSGDVYQLPWSSAIALAVGGEFRKEELIDVRTLENETGNVVGGAEGFGFHGKRNVSSLFAETKIPVLKNLELQLAARFEDYSDFGTTTKPKVAFIYRPLKWLALRASYSQSFKAPDLAYLYTKGSVSFTSSAVFDPRRPDQPSAQLKTLGRGNSSLQPETTDTQYYGTVIEAPKGSLLDGLQVELAYWRYDRQKEITRDSATFTLTNELKLPAGRVVRKDLTAAEIAAGYTVGIIDYIATDWYNASKTRLDGWDIDLRYVLKTDTLGRFTFGADGTYVSDWQKINIDPLTGQTLAPINLNGTDSAPRWRATFTTAWKKGDWAASVFVTAVGGFPPAGLTTLPEPRVKDQWRVNPQVSYSGIWNTNITVGVRNVFNQDPSRYMDNSTGYIAGIAPIEKAFWYVRLQREF